MLTMTRKMAAKPKRGVADARSDAGCVRREYLSGAISANDATKSPAQRQDPTQPMQPSATHSPVPGCAHWKLESVTDTAVLQTARMTADFVARFVTLLPDAMVEHAAAEENADGWRAGNEEEEINELNTKTVEFQKTFRKRVQKASGHRHAPTVKACQLQTFSALSPWQHHQREEPTRRSQTWRLSRLTRRRQRRASCNARRSRELRRSAGTRENRRGPNNYITRFYFW